MRAATRVALALLAAALPLGAAEHADCTFDPTIHRDAQSIRAEVSRLAELAAPSTGKRRSVGVPSISYYEARNFIDIHILNTLRRDKVAPAKRSSDSEFLRRVSIDIAGRIPTADEARAFLADTSADKRDRAIDRLLASDEFNDRWTVWFGDLVQNVTVANAIGQGVGTAGADVYAKWMRQAFADRKPYDAMVREVLTGSGNHSALGPANYGYRLRQANGPVQDTFDNAATQSGAQFLGMQLNCISCHDGAGHLELVNTTLSHLRRRQLWEMAAFFSKTSFNTIVTEPSLIPTEYRLNTTIGNKSARQPREGESDIVSPRYLTGGTPGDGEPWRTAYARYLTADRQFARTAVNRIWKELFGLGIVEPVDGFDLERLDEKATHPKLLEDLTDAFIAGGYDIRSLIRVMAQSNTYQLSSRYETATWKETLTPYFARHYPRRMMAEALFDSINQATSTKFDICGVSSLVCSLPTAVHYTKAMMFPDPYFLFFTGRNYWQFLADFGQGDRDISERSTAPSLAQSMAMMNDMIVIRGVRRSGGTTTVAAILNETRDPNAITEKLYLATLSRYPTDGERALATQYLRGGAVEDRTEDLHYVLLNKIEFLFN
jgi:hypothetical protein